MRYASRVLVLGTCIVMIAIATFAQDRVLLKFMVGRLGEQNPEAISGATITIVRKDGQTVATVVTDSSGLATATVPTGNYDAIVSASGYGSETVIVDAIPGESEIPVMLSPRGDEAVFDTADPPAPQPSGAISGRVLTLQGEPVSHASVTFVADNWYPQQSVVTADDGSFRLRLPLIASAGATDLRVQVRRHVLPMPKTSTVVYMPDNTEFSSRVRVFAGFESKGLELRVATHPEYFVKVAVRDLTGEVPPGVEISMSTAPALRLGVSESSAGMFPAGDDGAVMFGPLQPGPVTLWAATNQTRPSLAALAQIQIEDRVPDDVILRLMPAARVKGRVEFAGLSRPLRGASPLRVLAAIAGHGAPGWHSDDSNGVVQMDGSFVLDGLVGERCLRLVNVGPGWVLQSTMVGGRDATNAPLVFESGQEVGDVVLRVTQGDPVLSPPRACNGPSVHP